MAHICHISTTFNRRSGSARRIATLLEACVEAGYHASLLIGDSHDLRPGHLPEVTVEVVPGLSKEVRPRRDREALRHLERRLGRLRPDLVHTHLAKAGILGRWAAARRGVPRIAHTVHGPTFPDHLPWLRRGVFRALERLAARRTDAMIYVGDELMASYLAAGVGSAERSRVIRTARFADQLAFQPAGDEERSALRRGLCGGEACEMLLVFVGRLVSSKRPEHAIEAAGRLRAQGVDARLVVVGEALAASEGAWERRLREQYEACPRVHFTGFRHDVLEIMACADAVLITSLHEGLPNVAVEAVLAGTPVIGYRVLGLAELIEHRDNGWLVSPDRPRALVEALLEMRADRARRSPRQIEDAIVTRRQAVIDEYSQQRMIDATLAVYRQLLATPRGNA